MGTFVKMTIIEQFKKIKNSTESVLFIVIIGLFCSFEGVKEKNIFAFFLFLFLAYGIIWCIKDLIGTEK